MHNRIISKTPPNAVLVVRPLRHMPLTAYIEVVDLMTQNTLDIFLCRQNFRIQFSSVQPTVQCASFCSFSDIFSNVSAGMETAKAAASSG